MEAERTVATPTAEEEAAAKEPHEKPTNLQAEHTRAASMNTASLRRRITENRRVAGATAPAPAPLTKVRPVESSANATDAR